MTRRLQRRSFLGIGMAGGLSLWAAGAMGSGGSEAKVVKAKSVLLIYEQGGLSHIDTWDPKPEIPVDHRSPHGVIATKVPGMQFTSLLAKTAQVADKLTVVRSLYHKDGGVNGHPDGTQYALSGEVPGGPIEMPDIGGVVTHRLGSACNYLPPYIMIPGNHEQAAMTRQGFLPPETKVFKTEGNLADPKWQVPNLGLLAGIDQRRFLDRRDLLSNLNVGVASGSGRRLESMQSLREKTVDMLTNRATHSAFQLSESPTRCATNTAAGIAGNATCWGGGSSSGACGSSRLMSVSRRRRNPPAGST